MAPLGGSQCKPELVEQHAAVGQAGQWVVLGQVGDAGLCLAAGIHVFQYARPVTVILADGSAAGAQPAPFAVDIQHAELHVHRCAMGEALLQCDLDLRQVVLADPPQPALAQGGFVGLAGKLAPAGGRTHLAVAVGLPQYQRACLGDRAVTLLTGLQAARQVLCFIGALLQCIDGVVETVLQAAYFADGGRRHLCGRHVVGGNAAATLGQRTDRPQDAAGDSIGRDQGDYCSEDAAQDDADQWPLPACLEAQLRLTHHQRPARGGLQHGEGEDDPLALLGGGIEHAVAAVDALQGFPVRHRLADVTFRCA